MIYLIKKFKQSILLKNSIFSKIDKIRIKITYRLLLLNLWIIEKLIAFYSKASKNDESQNIFYRLFYKYKDNYSKK